MKVYQTNEIKNIALLGSSGSGKTTLVEAMLFESGVIKRRGSVAAKNTVSDYFPVEQEYGYSVFSTVLHVEWNNKKLNIIDCPGSDDFVGSTVTALNVTDTAIILLNGQYGVEVGTQNHFRYTEKLNKPVIFLVNQLDNEKCDYDNILEQLKEAYGSKVVPIQYPIATGPGFNALIDVLLMKKYSWKPEGGAPTIEDIPAEEMDKAMEMHKALVEAAAENDENLMEKFFEQDSLSEDEMREGIRKGLIARGMFPVFCVCGGKDMGVRRLMEFLGNVVPFVSEMPKVQNTEGKEVAPDSNGPESLYFFKTSVEPHIGEVSYFKVMSGKVHEGDDLLNADRGSKERIAQIYVVAGGNRVKVEELQAGDIGAAVKLKDVKTGNTLNGKDCDYKFNFIKYPNSKYTRAIKPVNEADVEKMMSILNRMREEDPTWVIEQSKELKQTLVHGQGEFHLRTLKWRLENNEKLQVKYEEPKIPYRETITKAARADYRHKKQSGGAGQFGEVHLIVEPYKEGMPIPETYKFNGQEFKITVRGTEEIPLEWGGKLVFVNSIVGGSIDARFLPAIMKGIMSRMEQGPLTGSYARDVRVIVYDGKMHPVDSNEISFMLAGRNAFSEAFKNAGPKILEPIYDVEVFVPSDRMGDVMGDLQGRRAMIMGMSSEKGFEKLVAKVPLKEMSSYSTALSSLTGGRASFIMKFSSYELVPTDVQDKLIKDFEAKQTEE
ncbi:translation factor GTPase family protein [Bacteroides finegoldii]|uniref:Elongation factor G n=6 Tax=Bacteroides TaxID=816 RepID=A0A7J4YUG0_9BACE|nr:elongation factor G [Bacteroides finegoldii]EEX43356.1 translation elongation factor G [Bacteroides finegoldii DSM 17565]KAA5219343.1 elongation factor G [Bacteroides finegoldii]KAA5223258.1 elongation factor G [Bacteroides finegoldii]KAA5227968.1 elongation factor G [Bacteroides finegoldii]KAA5233245.1 elongation factor G [Bacteroides finegoldii]